MLGDYQTRHSFQYITRPQQRSYREIDLPYYSLRGRARLTRQHLSAAGNNNLFEIGNFLVGF
jgi:hypothetical protein